VGWQSISPRRPWPAIIFQWYFHKQSLSRTSGSTGHTRASLPWTLGRLRRQLELGTACHHANSTDSPQPGFIFAPQPVITLVKPRIYEAKKGKRVSSAEYKKSRLFLLLWLRNTLVVFLLLKTRIEIPYAVSHLHNSNV